MSAATAGRGGVAWMALRLAAPGTGRPAPRAAARMALALGGPLAVGLAIGRPVLGMIAALAAFFTALIEPVGGYRAHITVYLVMAPVNAGIAALASAVSGTVWQAGIAGLAIGLASGILVGSTSRAAVAGPFPLFLFVVVQGTAPQPEPWAAAAAAATGALWVALAAFAMLLIAPFAPAQVHVAEAWKAVSLLARAPRDPRRHIMALSALESARLDLMATPGRSARWHRRRQQLWNSTLLAEAATLSIIAIGADADADDALLDRAAPFCAQVARYVVWRRRRPDAAALGPPGALAAGRLVDRLTRGLDALDADPPGGRQPPPIDRRRLLAPLAASARWSSPGFRHGLRLGIGAGGLMAIIGAYGGSLFDLTTHGAWVTITLVDVLAPSLGASVQRVAQRALGTAAGALVAAFLIWVLGDPWLVAVVAVAVGTTAALIRFVNYAWFMALFTPLVLLVASTAAPLGPDVAAQRVVATFIGCGLGAILALLVWPTRTGPDLPATLARAVDAVADDMQAGLESARSGSPITELDAVHRQAMAAADDALQAFDGVLLESLSRRAGHSPIADMQSGTCALVERAAVLGARMPDRLRVVPGTEATAAALVPYLRDIAAAMRTRRAPLATAPPPVAAEAMAPDSGDALVADGLTALADGAGHLAASTARWVAAGGEMP